MRIVEQYLRQLNTKKLRFRHSAVILSVLSLLVVLAVSWNLRQTGIAIANDASCGYVEHLHTDECGMDYVLVCGYGSEETTEPPTYETTEPTTEDFTELPGDETTEAPSEDFTELPEDETTEAPEEDFTEYSEDETTEAPAEVPEETQAETVLDAVLDFAADVISEILPEVHAADIPDAFPEEHVHTEACYEYTWLCGLEEHIHDLSCYSDISADLEDWNIWQASIPELTGNIAQDVVLVAQSQLGCKESEMNFDLGADGVTQNGITRYGQWYGNPYGSWSNMFTSFCIRFAGGSDLPINSGAEKMMMDWESLNLYRHAGGYEPMSGDIIFFDKNQNGTPESTGVVVRYFDFVLTVIEGDVDNAVVQQEYRIDDPEIFGYGMVNFANRIPMMVPEVETASAPIATTVDYTDTGMLTNGARFILYAIGADGNAYAMDANGNAVSIEVEDGFVFSDETSLFWTVNRNNNGVALQNGSKYLYPNTNGTLLNNNRQNLNFSVSGTGVKIQGYSTGRPNYTSYYAQLAASNQNFTSVGGQNNASTFYLAQAPSQVTLWLDGTNGGLQSYRDSWNRTYTNWNTNVQATNTCQPYVLPDIWQSPTTYQYSLAGWVNIKTGEYYEPGDTIILRENTVLYADWVAASYDIGQNKDNVVRTSSTSDFITTYLFDYNALINLMSTKATITVNANSHSESWSHVSDGDATYAGQTTLDFSFVDDDWNDGRNYNNKLDDPANRSDRNLWTGEAAGTFPGIVGNLGDYVLDDEVITTLFGRNNAYNHETGEGIIGKNYLGTGDYLFQYDEETGYYYYDADLNAASYNQSEQRFYIYDYLERSSDSPGNGSYSDFLPLNSPYTNTAGSVTSGTHDGTAYYEYEARKETNNRTRTEWLYGMRTDISFGLPDDAGSGNRDIYGNEMNFKFTGDDDVWILIDGKLVLDLGGIHLATEGDINFSTGVITTTDKDGKKDSSHNLSEFGIKAGEHTLTILYLERGASMANCAIYFNLAPRFAIELRKEDVLTQNALDGAQFAFYTDRSCAKGTECELWPSYEAYKRGDPASNVFTAHFGTAFVWGLNPSTTYYIKEVKSPKGEYFDTTSGIIKITLSKVGMNSYGAEILPDENGKITNGFNVHGFSVDEEAQIFYLHITNAQNWVEHTTSVYVEKEWNDTKNHDADAVTVYLNVTDRDGTVRRLRQIDLCEENNWQYTWSNLPMYRQDPISGEEDTTSEFSYSVEEAYVPGYEQVIRPLEPSSDGVQVWGESQKFENGGVYLLKFNITGNNYLASESDRNDRLQFVNENTAKTANRALWKATVSSNLVKLTNVASGRSITFDTDKFKASNKTNDANSGAQNLTQIVVDDGVLLSFKTNNNKVYYMGTSLTDNKVKGTTDMNTAVVIIPVEKRDTANFDGYGYRVTNTPLPTETSLKVTKVWEHPFGDDNSAFRDLQVTFKLYRTIAGENQEPEDTGRTVTVDRYCDWTAEFKGLPYKDAFGRVYNYTVEESWDTEDWRPEYGSIQTISGTTPTYKTDVTNVYRWTDAFELPSTGGIGYPMFILIGLLLIAAPFVYGFRMRRRYRKGARR